MNSARGAGWGRERLERLLAEPRLPFVPVAGSRLGVPLARPGQILCLGANCAAHAAEFGVEVPDTPVVFAKAPSALNGPFDPILLPPDARCVDAEVELAVVVGRTLRRASEREAEGVSVQVNPVVSG